MRRVHSLFRFFARWFLRKLNYLILLIDIYKFFYTFLGFGNIKMNSDPFPTSEITLTLPPCKLMICFTIARPNPVPPVFLL